MSQNISNTYNDGFDNQKDENVPSKFSIGKVVCVGRNYAAHAAELGNEVPSRPILFIKPASCVINNDQPIASHVIDMPRDTVYKVHYEAELCVRIGQPLKCATVEEVKACIGLIDGVTLGLDLTLRDLQSELKDKGHPWERAKCFDGSCVLAEWVAPDVYGDFSAVNYQLYINDKLTQDGKTEWMLFPLYDLLSEISYTFSLQPGDVIMTGTPSGVGVLNAGDNLTLKLGEHHWQSKVI
ncbi:fumarylacetoacetate hydrolase family protein [Psychrobacter sp.]|uniref:fumarylacetoacetate hydrolase family protein n=1 Tax=Psychrobacter sp. TaxID=56811 RepID=UPI0025DA0B31|nr:fumarylacetoacetate hydrolase family protein [Psychrobacter sp.]